MWNDSEEDIVTRDLHQLIVDEGSDEGKRCGRETTTKVDVELRDLQ